MANHLAQAPNKTTKYTIEDIDTNLRFLADVLKVSGNKERENVIRRVNMWLDRRLELVDSE